MANCEDRATTGASTAGTCKMLVRSEPVLYKCLSKLPGFGPDMGEAHCFSTMSWKSREAGTSSDSMMGSSNRESVGFWNARKILLNREGLGKFYPLGLSCNLQFCHQCSSHSVSELSS